MSSSSEVSDLTFMDTETLGRDPAAPIWEFAAIRRFADPHIPDAIVEIMIQHDPGHWVDELPEKFRRDYEARYRPDRAVAPWLAATMIHDIIKGTHVVGAITWFDTERLTRQLLARYELEEPWHYHLIEMENRAIGWLAGRGIIVTAPWDSNDVSRRLGVDPDDYARHTAMGDVLWTRALYDVVMGGP